MAHVSCQHKTKPETAMTEQPNTASLERAIRENLFPEGVAAVIAILRTANISRPKDARQRDALQEVAWLANRLVEMLGVDEYNRLLDELAL